MRCSRHRATMADITEDDVIAALSEVVDPSQGRSVVELGMVSAIHIKQSNISFALEVPAHRGPAMEPVRKAAETAARAIPGVTSATVVVTAHSGAGAGGGEAANEAAEDGADDGVIEKVHDIKIRRFVAVASGKGGVGKSTTAVNLAIALRLEGLRVGLLDADVYGPSLPRMLGVSGRPASAGGDMVRPLENYGVHLMSMGLLVPDDTAMIWRGPMVQSALTQMLDSVAWGTLDVIVIDLPPGTGDIQISLAQQVNLTGAVVVSTPQDIALLDVVKAITMFDKAEVPILGMVQNMAYWACPDCGRTDHIFGDGGVADEAGKRGIELLGEIPLSLEVRTGGDSGTPVVVASPRSEQAKTYRSIARRLMEVADLQRMDEEEEA
uniref:Iron-sulfur cluster carrier protein n=1 Tax=uncultured bacterium MedeBAC46A06 TaxID=332275 RepID=Q4PJG4_9BACT|nr:predicted ATPase [uncultured bacterium MedeBAC46A06]